MTINEFLLLKKLEEMRTYPSKPGNGENDLLLNRLDVIQLVEKFMRGLRDINRGLDVVAEREGTITFGPNFVKIKFPNCPSFTADTLPNALEIATRIGGTEGGPK